MKMDVFDKSFDVELVNYIDNSTENSISRTVYYKVDGQAYIYNYTGSKLMALGSVIKSTGEEVYSPWRYIQNGSYYEEIGKRLSVQNRSQN